MKLWVIMVIMTWLAAGCSQLIAEEPASDAVAVVNGETLTLRMLEDSMLRKEGAELVEELVQRELDKMPWTELKDDDVIVQIANWRLRRVGLAAQLLGTSAGKVRDELINITLVKQAMAAAGLTVGDEDIKNEIARMQARLDE